MKSLWFLWCVIFTFKVKEGQALNSYRWQLLLIMSNNWSTNGSELSVSKPSLIREPLTLLSSFIKHYSPYSRPAEVHPQCVCVCVCTSAVACGSWTFSDLLRDQKHLFLSCSTLRAANPTFVSTPDRTTGWFRIRAVFVFVKRSLVHQILFVT